MAEIVDFGLQQHKIKMDSRHFENVLSVVAGDTGRRIEVQLLDTNGMVQDTTGLNLRLNALVAGKATFTDATLVDAATGKYQLDLSNGMFLAPGKWQFQWQVTDATGKKLHSFAFKGNVGSNISEGGSQATNFYLNSEDLKAMQEDFINGSFDSAALETNIAGKLTTLETEYAPRLTEVTTQLEQVAKVNKTCEMLGLIPNVLSEANNNYTKLVNGMKEGYVIVVDNHYFISGNNTTSVIDKDINLIGLNGSFTLLETNILHSSNLHVEGIRFETQLTTNVFELQAGSSVKSVSLLNNRFEGNIRSFAAKNSSVDEIIFDGNETNNNSNIFSLLDNVLSNTMLISRNKGRNITKQMFNMNNMPNPEFLLDVNDNDIVNDIWAENTSMYLCFILYVGGGTVYYKNNRVIGLKTKTGTANVYDAYLSAGRVFYEQNIWKDNVTVSETRGKNGLFKAKSGNGRVIRVVRNNQFLMSDELIDSLTDSEKARLSVVPWDFTTNISRFDFSSNVINVYHLTHTEYDDVDVFDFNKNVITTEIISNHLINMNPTANGSVLNISNNTIHSNDSITGGHFYREFLTSSNIRHKKITIANNVITMNLSNGFMYGVKADTIYFSGNTIESIWSDATYLMHYGNVGSLVGINNKITSNGDVPLFRETSSFEDVDFSIDISRKKYNRLQNRITMGYNILTGVEKNLMVSYDIFSSNERKLFDLYVSVGRDDGGVYVKYKDSNGVIQKTYGEGSYPNLPVNTVQGSGNNFNLYLSDKTIYYLFSTNIPDNTVEKISLKSF